MAALDPDKRSRSAIRRAARWLAPLTGVAVLGVFSAQALGQSTGPKQISVPSLPTTSLPTTASLPVPPPPLPTTTTTTTVSTPVATAPVPVPTPPPAPPATPPVPTSTTVPTATNSGPAQGGGGASSVAGTESTSASGSSAGDGAAASDSRSGAADGEKGRAAPRLSGLRAKPARFEPSSKTVRRGTILVFRLDRRARLRITVYGPGPSCARLGTFGRRGRAGLNRVRVSGSLFGRPLAPGRYAIVVESVRRGHRVRIGDVVVTILPRDGREGGSRPLAAPDCSSRPTIAFLASGGGDFVRLSGGGATASGTEPGAVAGVSAERGGDDLPLLPDLPALPALPTLPVADALSVPPWGIPALVVVVALGAAALVAFGFHRHREDTWSGWD